MILALDETGDFRADSIVPQFFVAAQVRKGKKAQFKRWEKRLPRRLKGGDGEFKAPACRRNTWRDSSTRCCELIRSF